MKDTKLSIRISSEDLSAIKTLAKRAGLSMSNYVTACCLGQQLVVVDGLKETLSALSSIGNNLNQLTTLAHLGRVRVVGLEQMSAQLADLKTAVCSLGR